MKRRSPGIITRVIVFLLLGAIVNVAVAWCASLMHQYINHQHLITPLPPGWTTWPRVAQTSMPARTRFHEETREASLFEQFDAGDRTLDVLSRYSAGWPCLSLCGELRTTATGIQCIRPSVVVGSNVPWLLLMECRPIGFVINTLFYAGILWLMFAAPFALRRRRRIKRGLCPACAYPAGDSAICTECGRPVGARVQNA